MADEEDEARAALQRRLVVHTLGYGWVQAGFFPADRYRLVHREDGWSVFIYDEEQEAWDREHGL